MLRINAVSETHPAFISQLTPVLQERQNQLQREYQKVLLGKESIFQFF